VYATRSEEHRLHNIFRHLCGAAELNCELQVLERWIYLPLGFAFGGGRLPEPGLWDSSCGLNPCKTLFDGRTPGRDRQIIVDFVQQIPDFRQLRTELLSKPFPIVGKNMVASASQRQPGVEEDAFHGKRADPFIQCIEHGNGKFGGSKLYFAR